ncbi:MAG: hypothetical protein V1662_06605 [Candidatus Omnitrophota bacterium]
MKRHNGTVLIFTLWILVVLTLFAVSLGERASLEVKMAQYDKDKLKAGVLAKAAMERCIWEKQRDKNPQVDTLNESWSNNEAVFKDFRLTGEKNKETFSASYELGADTFYGMQDEQSKININTVEWEVLKRLLESCGTEQAEDAAVSVLVWCGKIVDPAVVEEEKDYYRSLDWPYECKQAPFKSIPELLLARRMTPEILYGKDKNDDGKISPDEWGIAPCLTIYGPGSVNINTASDKVLLALIGDETLVDVIIAYRKGADGKIGTEDDLAFSVVGQALTVHTDFFNVYGGTPLQLALLQNMRNIGMFGVNSIVYTIAAQGKAANIEESFTATIDFNGQGKEKYLYWHKK